MVQNNSLYQNAKSTLAGNPAYELLRGVRVDFRQWRQARARAWLDTKSYQERKVINVDELERIRGARVLVVGASRGEDCRLFVDRGAKEVHGLDIVEDVGCDYRHRRVQYHRAGIEMSGLISGTFDIVFSVATMEHVPNIRAGFAEMVRLTRPGGLIYCHSAPLWQSPHGHHMGCFDGHPWVHLVFERDELIDYSRQQGIDNDRGHSIEAIVDYMLNLDFFNMKPGHDYVDACANLAGIQISQNELIAEEEILLSHPLGHRALTLGYLSSNLLGTQHNFIARKL